MIAVIDVSGTNLTSLGNALSRLGFDYILTHNAEQIQAASHVILPGVGTATYGMNALQQHGLVPVLSALTQPLLGICLGMQLLLDYSEEGQVACLGLIPGRAELLIKHDHYPVPHMGWNQLQWCRKSPLQQGISDTDHVYFVHSYALRRTEHALAHCEYGETFSAIINKGNVFGMQFHPEKSATVGMQLLNNFCSTELIC
ncbi:MAG: imidazole glycerol phosphate synthase subunit HisH [Legionellales bacterium]